MAATFHHFHRVARFDLGDAHRLLLSQRELLRAITSASMGRDEATLNEVLHRAATAASTTLSSRPQLILPPPPNPALATATWSNLVGSLRHAVHVARESLPVIGGVAAVAAVAAIAMHVTAVWLPRWAATAAAEPATRKRRTKKSSETVETAAPAAEVTDLMAEITALRAELEQYRTIHGDMDHLVASHELESTAAAAHVSNLEAVNKALTKSVETLEAELSIRRAAEDGLRGEVNHLKNVVEGLTEERDRAENRMLALEGSLESLRQLFSSIAAANNGHIPVTEHFEGEASYLSTGSSSGRSSTRHSSGKRRTSSIASSSSSSSAAAPSDHGSDIHHSVDTAKSSILTSTTLPSPLRSSAAAAIQYPELLELTSPQSTAAHIDFDLFSPLAAATETVSLTMTSLDSVPSSAASSPRVVSPKFVKMNTVETVDAAVLQVVEEEEERRGERPASAVPSEDDWEEVRG